MAVTALLAVFGSGCRHGTIQREGPGIMPVSIIRFERLAPAMMPMSIVSQKDLVAIVVDGAIHGRDQAVRAMDIAARRRPTQAAPSVIRRRRRTNNRQAAGQRSLAPDRSRQAI